jgi:hypothetical protein
MEKKNMSTDNVTNINEPRNFIITSPPNEATLTPEWGLRPGRAVPISYGARAIFNRGEKLDFLWDRNQIIGGTPEERGAFSKWVNANVPKIAAKMIKDFGLEPSDAAVVTGYQDGIEVMISPRKSFGYLYIGAWPTDGMIEASKEVNAKPGGRAAEAHDEEVLKRGGIPGKDSLKLPKGSMWAVVVRPGEEPVIEIIKKGLHGQQAVVGGMIQHVPVTPKRRYTIVVNEEGLILGLKPNRRILFNAKNPREGTHDLYGTILLVQEKGMTYEYAKQVVEEWAL